MKIHLKALDDYNVDYVSVEFCCQDIAEDIMGETGHDLPIRDFMHCPYCGKEIERITEYEEEE